MKFTLALSLVVLLMAFEPIYGVKVCNMPSVGNCNENVPVCGRFGRSNLCKAFKNKCALEYDSCISTAVYTPVNAELCTGIVLNTRRSCYGLNNNNNNGGSIGNPGYKPGFKPGYNPGGKWSHWFGNGNGNGVQQQPAVKPIVINAGK